MPTVPVYDNLKVSPSSQPTPAFRAPDVPDVASKQMQQTGQVLQGVGGAANKMALDLQEEANRVRVLDGLKTLSETEMALTFDKDKGYKVRRGKDAFEGASGKLVADEFDESYQAKINELLETFGNDAQKQMFLERAEPKRLGFKQSVQAHGVSEFMNYKKGVLQDSIKLSVTEGALNWNNPDKIKQALADIDSYVYEAGEMAGRRDEAFIKTAAMEAKTPLHAAVIQSAVDGGNTLYAKEYLSEYGEQMNPQARQRAALMIEKGDFIERSQTNAERFIAEAGGDYYKAISLVRENLSGEDENATIQNIKIRQQEFDANKRMIETDALNSALDYLNLEGGTVETIPASVQLAMNPQQLRMLKASAKKSQKETTDKTLYSDIDDFITQHGADVDGKEFKIGNEVVPFDLRLFQNSLRTSDYVRLQNRIRAKKEGNAGEDSYLGTANNLVNIAAQAAGMKKKDDIASIKQAVHEEAEQFRNANGGKITDSDIRKIVNEKFMKGAVPGTLYGTNESTYYQAVLDGKGDTFVPEGYDMWTDNRKAEAAAFLKKMGYKATPYAIHKLLFEEYTGGK